MGDFSYDCFKPYPQRVLGLVCRTLPPFPPSSIDDEMYQFEDFSAVLDEDNAQQIQDNLKNN